MITYEISHSDDGRFFVGHRDENGEFWDADLDGFDTLQEAQVFLQEAIEDMDESSDFKGD
jgi:hypothetical protein